MREAKKILSSNFIVFAGTITAGLFSYLFNMLAGRWLGPSRYGEFSALLSLLTIVSVGGGSVTTITMRYAGELHTLGNYDALRRLFYVFTRSMLFLATVLILMSAVLVKPIAHFLSLEHLLPLFIILLNFIFGFLMFVNRGILQGTQKFTALSVLGTIEMALRFLLGALLIKIGLGLTGAVAAAVLATAIAYGITFIPLVSVLRLDTKGPKKKFTFNKKEILNYSWPTFLATTLLVLSLNLDIILTKHYFSAEQAGLYAAISTIAKIIFFITGPMVTVMFPMITEHRAKGEKHYRIFLFSLALTLAAALMIQAVYSVAPGTIISILYGQKYAQFYYLLPLVGLVIIIYSLTNVIVNYFISIRDFVFLPIFGLLVVLQGLAVIMWHSTLEVVIKSFIVTQGLLFLVLFGYYLFTKKEQLWIYLRGDNGEA